MKAPTAEADRRDDKSQGVATGAPGSLPDLNAETYPVPVVQRLLEQAAYFNMYAVPLPGHLKSSDPGDAFDSARRIGFAIGLDLHDHAARVQAMLPLAIEQDVGPPAATYKSRWMLAPFDHAWSPGKTPPQTVFDPRRSQTFVMLGDLLRFGSSQRHGFSGYGLGRTFPDESLGSDRIMVGAVGNVTGGFGKFRGLEGTYIFNGVLIRGQGFRGLLACRMIDPEGLFREGADVSALVPSNVKPQATYFVMAGKKPSEKTPSSYGPPPTDKPNLVNLITTARMRAVQYPFTDAGAGGLRSQAAVGDEVGDLNATITLDILAPLGTADAPTPFTVRDVYQVRSRDGREVGTLTVQLELGEAFRLSFRAAPGQLALRFGAVGRIVEGTGAFANVRGLAAVNSAVGLMPHVLAIMHILQLVDGGGTSLPAQARPAAEAGGGSAAYARPSAPSSDQTATVVERDVLLRSGERMHYREAGPRDGRPILMLHGNPASSFAWTPVMRLLSDLGRCIAPDLIGFGDSSKPRAAPSYYHHAEYLDQFVEGMGLRNVTLFIQDWGGALGFDHAVRHQDNVRGIAFFEAILKPYDSWDVFPQKFDRAKLDKGDPQQFKSGLARQKFQEFRASRKVGSPGWEQIAVHNVFLKIFMGPLLGHPFDPREIPDPAHHPVLGPLLEPYLRPFPTELSRTPIWQLCIEIPIEGGPPDTVATIGHYSRVLAEWDVPKLLIYSDKGPTLKEEHAEWVRQNWRKNLTVRSLDQVPGVTVTEGTHFLQQTHPKEVAGFFREWYSSLR